MKSLREAWCRETSADPDNWTPLNPAWGQCAVTCLVLQDLLGGRLWRGEVKGVGSHYVLTIPQGTTLDLTAEQFSGSFVAFHGWRPRDREALLENPDTLRRYELLKERLATPAPGLEMRRDA